MSSNKRSGPIKSRVSYRKILRDNILGITRPVIRRLAQQAGVTRVSGPVYTVVRDCILQFLKMIESKALAITQHSRKKTLLPSAVSHVLPPDINVTSKGIIPTAPFSRLVREVAQDILKDLNFSRGSFDMLRSATEQYVILLFTKANQLKGKRVTLFHRDIEMANKEAMAAFDIYKGEGFTLEE